MDIDWKAVGVIGTVVAGVAALHGLKSRKWKDIHTFGVLLGLLATAAPYMLDE